MYSVVLMMALTTGGDSQAFGHHGCCGGYSSCCGGYSSCCGGYGGYSSCCGGYGDYSSCCGGYSSCCGGGGHHGLFGGHHHNSCCGGYSSCCGGYGGYSSCCGGYGGYSSCCGGYGGYSGCCGGYGGYSSCCGGGYYGGYSGCCGGGFYGCDGGMIYGAPVQGAPVTTPTTTPGTGGEPIGKPKPPEALTPAPATIIVSLPADAKLTIDDAATVSTSSVRVFTSPELPVGQDFHYTLKAEYSHDGKPVVSSKEVTVRAGEQTRVNMEETAGVASR